MQAGQETDQTSSAGEPAVRAALISPLDVVVLAVLAAGLIIGVALWGKWGFLIAFEALTRYCF